MRLSRLTCLTICALALATSVGCSKSKHRHDAAPESVPAVAPSGATPDAGVTPPAAVPPAPPAPAPASPAAAAGVGYAGLRSRLTPEQFANFARRVFQLEMTVPVDSYGLRWDRVDEKFGVQLGGVDFESSFQRDATPTAQMVLAVRAVAIETASAVVNRDRIHLEKDEPPVTFTLCNLNRDRPATPEDESAVKWRLQLEDFYWKILGRAPGTEDLAAASNAFLATKQAERGNTRRAWLMVLYGILSSAEFWAL